MGISRIAQRHAVHLRRTARYKNRFDRVFFKHFNNGSRTLSGKKNKAVSPSTVSLLGPDDVVARNFETQSRGHMDLAPSDHFGLRVT